MASIKTKRILYGIFGAVLGFLPLLGSATTAILLILRKKYIHLIAAGIPLVLLFAVVLTNNTRETEIVREQMQSEMMYRMFKMSFDATQRLTGSEEMTELLKTEFSEFMEANGLSEERMAALGDRMYGVYLEMLAHPEWHGDDRFTFAENYRHRTEITDQVAALARSYAGRTVPLVNRVLVLLWSIATFGSIPLFGTYFYRWAIPENQSGSVKRSTVPVRNRTNSGERTNPVPTEYIIPPEGLPGNSPSPGATSYRTPPLSPSVPTGTTGTNGRRTETGTSNDGDTSDHIPRRTTRAETGGTSRNTRSSSGTETSERLAEIQERLEQTRRRLEELRRQTATGAAQAGAGATGGSSTVTTVTETDAQRRTVIRRTVTSPSGTITGTTPISEVPEGTSGPAAGDPSISPASPSDSHADQPPLAVPVNSADARQIRRQTGITDIQARGIVLQRESGRFYTGPEDFRKRCGLSGMVCDRLVPQLDFTQPARPKPASGRVIEF